MSLQRFAAITSTNAAKILGLYPQKGVIAPGSDADLVLIDPTLTKTLTLDDLHADSDYSIWEGFTCHGYPVMTILRGQVVVDHGRLLGSASDGQWLRRKVRTPTCWRARWSEVASSYSYAGSLSPSGGAGTSKAFTMPQRIL